MQHQHAPDRTLVTTSVSFTFVIGLFPAHALTSRLLTPFKDESERDLLSGVLNRRGIEQKLEIELKRIERSDQPLSIALIDIDHFKTINDTAGHAAGDTALRDVVTAISERLRAYDLLGRFGGDEFLLVLPHTSCRRALRRSHTHRATPSVRSRPVHSGPSLTISIGLTQAVVGEITRPRSSHAPTRLSTRPRTLAATAAASSCTIPIATPRPNRSPDRRPAPLHRNRSHPILTTASSGDLSRELLSLRWYPQTCVI